MSHADLTIEASGIDIRCEKMKLESRIEIKDEDSTEFNSYGEQGTETTIKEHELIELIDSDSDVPEESFHGMVIEIDNAYKETMVKIEKIKKIETVPTDPSIRVTKAHEIQRSEKSLVHDNLLPSFCRLCAIPCNDLIHIFGPTPFHKRIIEKIQYCLPITVEKSDALSKHVCRSCLEKLESCYQFHKTVNQAEEQLFEFYAQTSGRVDQETQIHRQTSGQSNEQLAVTKNADINGNSGRRSASRDPNHTKPNDSSHPDKDDREKSSNCENQDTEVSKKILNSNKPSTSQEQHGVTDSTLDSQTEKEDSEEELESAEDISDSEDYSPPVTRKRSSCGVRSHPSISRKSSYWMRERTPKNYYIGDVDRPACDEANKGQASSSARRRVTKCHICRKAFRTAKEWNIHLSTHDSPNYYPCCHCDKVHRTKREREEHWSEHINTKRGKSSRKVMIHRCEECGEKFPTRGKLRAHKPKHRHAMKNGVYNDCCQGCVVSREPKESNARQGEHLLQYTPCKLRLSSHSLDGYKRGCAGRTTTHECSSCGKVFKYLSSLRRHVLTHVRGQSYGCDICTKIFPCECRVVSHRKVHMSKRLPKCSICARAFNSSQRLIDHMRYVHYRPIRADPRFPCDKRFMKVTAREILMGDHTHKSSYKRDLCNNAVQK